MAEYYVLDGSSLVDVHIDQLPSLGISEQSYLARSCLRCTLQEGKEVSSKDVVVEGTRSRMGQGKVSKEDILCPGRPSETTKKRQPGMDFAEGSTSQEGTKRKRHSSTDSQENDMNSTMFWWAQQRNNNMLNQLSADLKLMREQHKEQCESIVKAITKITDDLQELSKKLNFK